MVRVRPYVRVGVARANWIKCGSIWLRCSPTYEYQPLPIGRAHHSPPCSSRRRTAVASGASRTPPAWHVGESNNPRFTHRHELAADYNPRSGQRAHILSLGISEIGVGPERSADGENSPERESVGRVPRQG